MKQLLYFIAIIPVLVFAQTEPIRPESVTTDNITSLNTSSGLALKNNAGTTVVLIGVGSSSATNSTWTGNIVQTGTISSTGDLTLTSGKQTRGANGRTIVLDKTVTLTDATLTAIATLTLPTGSNMGGGYSVGVVGIITLGGSGTGSFGGKRIEASFSFGQDSGAISSEGAKTTSSTGVSFGDALGGRDVSLTAVSVAISGTDNSTHAIQLNVDGTGSTGGNPTFVGTITIHYIGFTTFSAQ